MLNKLDEIKSRVAAFKIGEYERGHQWTNGPGEDFEWLINEVEKLRTELNREIENRLEMCAERTKLREQLGVARKVLLDIARANYGGPCSEERREWTWATSEKAYRDIEENGK